MQAADGYRKLDPAVSLQLTALYYVLCAIDDRLAATEHVHMPDPRYKEGPLNVDLGPRDFDG